MSDGSIRVRPNGPFLVEGNVTLTDSEGNKFPGLEEKPAFAICRCTHSKNQPFCDGSHKSCEFHSDPKVSNE